MKIHLSKFGILCSIILLFSLFAGQGVSAQVQTARANTFLISNSNGFYEYLPQGYSATGTATYPLLIFIHGIKECGAGTTASLPLVLRNGPPKLINNGTFPTSFTVNGQTSKFIVISPQFKAWPSATDINGVINYCISHYKIDTSRIYLTGLSMGGGTTWNAGGDPVVGKRLAAIAPMCGATSANATRANVMADNNLGVWAFHNLWDATVSSNVTINFIKDIKARNANAPAKMTIWGAGGHVSWTKAYDPTYTENGINLYQFFLQFKKGATVPRLPVDIAPTADAGGNKTITLASTVTSTSLSLAGRGTDTDNGISYYSWSKVRGPSGGSVANARLATTTASNLVPGTYVYRLTVNDVALVAKTDSIVVVVTGSGTTTTNKAPVANAGADKTITLPTSSVSLTGSGTDADGTISSYAWSKVSGPTSFTIASPTAATTSITGLVQGTYIFKLTVKDNGGATDVDSVKVTVNAAATTTNTPPVANAGANRTLTLPLDSVVLSGSATDADGTISKYSWSKVSGPASNTFSSTTVASPKVKGLVAGTYIFRLLVTDNGGATDADSVTVQVNAATTTTNLKPVANAGADKTITLPVDSVVLSGSGTDADGTISKYRWDKISGPAQYSFSDSTNTSTKVKGLVAGTYIFRLLVKDNSNAYDTDSVIVTVNDAIASSTTKINIHPVANAGASQTITLPKDSVTLAGKGTDADGTISKYRWDEISGPAQHTFSDSTKASTKVNDLVAGTYIFRLLVKDNSGAYDTDTLKVVVNASTTAAATAASSTSAALVKYVKVNVYGGVNPYSNSQWNNWNTGSAAATNIKSGTLKYSDGSASGMTAVLSSSRGVNDNSSSYGSGMAPAEVLRYDNYDAAARTLTISGLNTNQTYSLELYSSRINSSNSTVFTVNGISRTVSDYNNLANKAVFSNLTPNAQGQIVVNLKSANMYNYLNGFTITEGSSTLATASTSQTTQSTSLQLATDGSTAVSVYPNPFTDKFLLKVNNTLTGAMKVQIIDMSGVVKKEFQLTKTQSGATQTYLSAGDLTAGNYILKVQIGTWSTTQKVVKQ